MQRRPIFRRIRSSFAGFAVATFAAMVPTVHAADEAMVAEARVRAQLLHETLHGALQVMHRDFFKEEERSRIPSESLEDVFAELEKSWQVKVSWMAVNAKPMSIDHKPSDAFGKAAVKALENGRESHEAVEGDFFRYAGAVTLGNRCLKCHVPDRTSLEDRVAAILITLPLQPAKKP
jgi:hypothetical protein